MEKTEKLTIEETKFSTPDIKKTIHRDFRSFLLSKKLWTTIFGLIVLWLAYWKEVDYLYSFSGYPNEMASILIPSFISLTRDFMAAFTAVVTSFVGIEGFVQWKHGTESIVNQATSSIQENINKKEEITENKNINLNEHIVEEGVNGAPLIRPFSQGAFNEEGFDE